MASAGSRDDAGVRRGRGAQGALSRARRGQRPADPIEIALAWNADAPHAAPAVARVTRTRLAFLHRIFTELGLPDDEATDRAWLTYAFYVGHHQLGRNSDLHERQPNSLDRVVELLTSRVPKRNA